jgi:diguanylate cyclase (GGDEF)-like protein
MKKKGATTNVGGRSAAAVTRRNGGGSGKAAKKAAKKTEKKTEKKAARKPVSESAPRPARVGTSSRVVSAPVLKSARDKETIRRLRRALSRALKLIQQLQASAETDYLLDILNRRGFERELARALAYIKRYHVSAALIVLDVDRLKPINDEFGHGAGDEVLKAIVGVLKAQVRASDVVGRLGGDEFALLLWNLNETEARAKAALLEQAIDRLAFLFGKSRVMAGASAGVAMLGTQAGTSKALEAADGAMYQRKAQRRHER